MTQTIVKIPLFLIKHWKPKTSANSSAELLYSVAYNEDDLLELLRTIYGNYFVFKVGEPYESKSHFDLIFKEEQNEKERQEYLKLKQKYEKVDNRGT